MSSIPFIREAEELLKTVSKEEAIQIYKDKIDKFTPKNFQEICDLSALEASLFYLENKK
jgi:hypothetical protein